MPDEIIVPSGNYTVRKRFRNEEQRRQKRDLPWSKKILDLEQQQLCGRSAWAWFRICGFYLVLYILISIIIIFWLLIFKFYILNENSPRWFKGAPGLAIVPGNGSTIKYYANHPDETDPFLILIDKFLTAEAEKKFSAFNADKTWGYRSKSPTVFIKINKVLGFKVDAYETIQELPKGTPDSVEDIMKAYKGKNRIWLTCEVTRGQSPKMNFIPGPYYDATSGLDGINRIVALQLQDMPHNTETFFMCRIWAKNIEFHEKQNGRGHCKFSMHVKVPEFSSQPIADTKKSRVSSKKKPESQEPLPPVYSEKENLEEPATEPPESNIDNEPADETEAPDFKI